MGNSALETQIIQVEEGTDTFRIIRSPDNRPAQSIMKRFLAELIDHFIIGAIFFIAQIITLNINYIILSKLNLNNSQVTDQINLFIFAFTYFFSKSIYYYILYRQKCTTFGKKFFHYRVYRNNTQEPIGIIRIIIREFFGKSVTLLFFPLSFLWYLLDSKNRLPHDFMSGTMLVEELKEHNGIDH